MLVLRNMFSRARNQTVMLQAGRRLVRSLLTLPIRLQQTVYRPIQTRQTKKKLLPVSQNPNSTYMCTAVHYRQLRHVEWVGGIGIELVPRTIVRAMTDIAQYRKFDLLWWGHFHTQTHDVWSPCRHVGRLSICVKRHEIARLTAEIWLAKHAPTHCCEVRKTIFFYVCASFSRT